VQGTRSSSAVGAARTNTIPGRSPVTRKHARGRKPQPSQVNMTAKTLKSESRGRATSESEYGTMATWSEPPTDAEILGRGKLDPNLPPKEYVCAIAIATICAYHDSHISIHS
jgi:hypothetical protein